MATIKAYTTIEQSRKLAEILPLESADMTYSAITERMIIKNWEVNVGLDIAIKQNLFSYRNGYKVPCWSLASLLGVASTYCSRLEITLRADKKYNVFAVKNDFVFRSFDDHPDGFDNLVDACVETILKLH